MQKLFCIILFILSSSVFSGIHDIPSHSALYEAIDSETLQIDAPHIIENLGFIPIRIKSVNYDGPGYIQDIWYFSDIKEEPIAYRKLNKGYPAKGLGLIINLPYVQCDYLKHIFIVARLNNDQLLGGKKRMKFVDHSCGDDHG